MLAFGLLFLIGFVGLVFGVSYLKEKRFEEKKLPTWYRAIKDNKNKE